MQPRKDERTTCTIPYIKGISESISRVLAPLEIRTVMKPRQIKWTLMKDAKDKLPRDQEPGAAYAIGCQMCPSVYIGETARTAKQRTKEHEMHTRHGHTELSAIANHAHMHAHNIHWILEATGNRERREYPQTQGERSASYQKAHCTKGTRSGNESRHRTYCEQTVVRPRLSITLARTYTGLLHSLVLCFEHSRERFISYCE